MKKILVYLFVSLMFVSCVSTRKFNKLKEQNIHNKADITRYVAELKANKITYMDLEFLIETQLELWEIF